MPEPIVVERRTTATAAAVYRYLTESTDWTTWQGSDAELDPRAGGIFRMQMPDGRTARGEYVDLRPNTRVVFTWGWIDYPGVAPGSTTVTVDLIEDIDGTLIRLTHVGLTPEEAAMHLVGWNHYLPRLSDAAEGKDPGLDPGPTPP